MLLGRLGAGALCAATLLWVGTYAALAPAPRALPSSSGNAERSQITDRHGVALSASYTNDWNHQEAVAMHEIPAFLVRAFVLAEDQRFFEHGGQDWAARLSALGQNLFSLGVVRGASTITEQVVRLLHPRPRSLWTRWVEGWEAERLERVYDKLDLLEFYLNQVPYAANRRGVVQAARFYFDRDLATLNRQEMLALAVMVRAPSRLDLYSGDHRALRGGIRRLAGRMERAGHLSEAELAEIDEVAFILRRPALPVNARHFLRHVRANHQATGARLRTTLDGALQARLSGLLDRRLQALSGDNVSNAALLVADHQSGEVLAWVVGGADDGAVPGRMIDAVTVPRQPGSALKPFLYALALERGWTAATLIDDAPLTEPVGYGLHRYENYSRTHYGPVTLRRALGNSLNIPAVRTIQFTGIASYLSVLEKLGFHSLSRNSEYYGDGLALGNGEVTLLELVRAYGALANRGRYRDLVLRTADLGARPERLVYSPEVASLLGNILSDPAARRPEFGHGSLLNLPVQTAVKTGTSSDYRDSWALGYNERHVVGVWMGNLDQTPTAGVTGSTGPAMVLRGAFDLLTRGRDTAPLWLSPRLRRSVICANTGYVFEPGTACPRLSEYFLPGSAPRRDIVPDPVASGNDRIRLRQPTSGLHLAYDPRLPASHQAFEFILQGVGERDSVDWHIDGAATGRQSGGRYTWSLSRGVHRVAATVWRDGQLIAHVDEVRFLVK